MSIRAAVAADIPQLVELGARMHAESSYARFGYDAEKVAGMLASAMQIGVVLVAEKGDEIVGGIAGAVADFWFGPDLYGFDFAVFVAPEHRHGVTALRLIVGFEAWCRRRGAREVRLGVTTGVDVDATAAFYERFGYRRDGVLFTKEMVDV